MKICFITNYFSPVTGGVESHIYYLAKELIKKGHSVTVYTSNSTRDGKINKLLDNVDGIKVKRFNTWFKIGDFGVFYPGIFKALKQERFDIIHLHVYRHFHNFLPYFIKGKFVLTPHWPNYPKNIRSNTAHYFSKFFDKFYGKKVLRKFDKILMITGIEGYWFRGKFSLPRSKFIIIPDGIPKDYLKLRNKERFRKKLGIKKDEIMVFLFSRIHKSKGFDQVVKIANSFPNVKFVIGGIDGGFKETLENLIKELKVKNVIFISPLYDEQKLEAFSAADIYIHPSRFEGFGIVILEAFSQGNAIITSNQGGMPWVIKDAGLIYEIDNLKELKQRLKLLIENKTLRNSLAKKGRERVKNFTWENIANDLEKVYLSL